MAERSFSDTTERTHSLLATAVCGAPVTVVHSARVASAGCASLARRTIWIDPERVGPYDLVLLAGVLRERRGLNAEAVLPEGAAKRRLFERTQTDLEREYPALRSLAGRWRGALADDDLPELAREGPALDALNFADGSTSLSASLVPGERLEGVEGDLERLAEAVARGRVPLREHPGLPGLRYVELPLTLRMRDRPREVTEEEREIRRTVDDAARGIVTCYENKTKGTSPVRLRLPRSSGTRLDPRRLHEVALAAVTGVPARPFVRPPREIQATFKPEQHYGILGFDAPSLHAAVVRRGHLRVNLLRVFARCFELMEIDSVIVGFRDRLLPIPGQGPVYLHVPCVAKAVDEPFSEDVWQRLQVLWAPPAGAGSPACSLALQLDTLARHARSAAASREHRYLSLQYMSVGGMPAEVENEAERRTAVAVADQVLVRLRDEVEAEWDFTAFIPNSASRVAPKGGILSGQMDLGI